MPGFTRYVAHRDGRIRSIKRGELTARCRRDGYQAVRLVGPRGRRQHYVHQVIAATFHGPATLGLWEMLCPGISTTTPEDRDE